MTQQTRLEQLAAAVGADVKGLQTGALDLNAANAAHISLTRIERETLTRQEANRAEILRRIADVPAAFTENWAALTAWTGTGQVGNGRLFASNAGMVRPAPTSARWVMRGALHTTGVSGKSAYMGIQLVDGAVLALGQTSTSATMFINRSGSVPAGSIVIPRTLPAIPAGDWIVTIVKDETCLSFTFQGAGTTGQVVYGFRIPLSALVSPIANVWVSTTDTVATGMTWGNVVIYNELEVPPSAVRMGLFGNLQPLVIWRQDTNGFGHYLSIPGDNDPRVPAPIVMFAHQSLASSGGGGTAPWAETRWANVLSALNAAGYILVSSDNGPGITSGGTQDKYGNQVGLDDYASLLKWARQRFNTSAAFVIGASMGAYFGYNLLQRREVGGIAAMASISGGFDLSIALNNATYRTPVMNAFGAVDDADFAAKTATYDPKRQPGWRFRGVPLRLYYGTADTLAPANEAVDPVVAQLSPYAPEVGVVSVAGAVHLDASLYQGADLVAFFEKYR